MSNKLQKFLIIIGSLLFVCWVFLNTFHLELDDVPEVISAGYKSNNSEKMQQVIIALNEENIPFTMDIEGFINYEAGYKERVDKIIEKVEGIRFGTESRKYSDKEHNEIFKEVLTSLNIEYKVDEREDGNYIAYDPGDIPKVKIDSTMGEFVSKRLGTDCTKASVSSPSNQSLNEDARQAGAC